MIISKIIYYICGVNSLSVFLKRTLGYCTGLFLVTNLRRNIYNNIPVQNRKGELVRVPPFLLPLLRVIERRWKIGK